MSIKESVTLAAMGVMALKVGLDDIAIVGQFSDFLKNCAANHVTDVELNAPLSVTMKEPAGGYTKKPMIGGETITLVSAYMGKRDGVIIQGKHRGEGILEFPAKNAESMLDGYEDLLNQFLTTYGMRDDTDDMIAAKSKADLLEHQAHEEATRKTRFTDERFGSW